MQDGRGTVAAWVKGWHDSDEGKSAVVAFWEHQMNFQWHERNLYSTCTKKPNLEQEGGRKVVKEFWKPNQTSV